VPLTEVALAREEADRTARRRLAHSVVAALVFMVAAVGLMIWMIGTVGAKADRLNRQVIDIKGTQHQISTTQQEGLVRGLKLRAVGCRTIEELGGTFPPGDPCLEPAVKPYFQPGRSGRG
jgi:hypothetical protein